MSKRPWYDRRDTTMKLEEIDAMIRAENEPEKRNVLLVLQCLTSNLASNSRLLEEIEEKLHSRITAQESLLEKQKIELANYHDITVQVKTGWKMFSTVIGLFQASILAIGIYGYTLIANLRDTVNVQSIILPELERKLETSNSTLNRLIKLTDVYYKKDIELETQDKTFEDLLSQTFEDLKAKNRKLSKISNEISNINSKKVIKHSK